MFYFFILLNLVFFARLWIASFYGLHPDEAYYYFWSQNPAMGYFDHPPMISWMIRAGQKIVSLFFSIEAQNQDPLFYKLFSIRLVPSFFAGVIAPLTLGQCVQNIQKSSLRVSQMIFLITAPMLLVGPLLITPDAPFFAAWALCIFYSTKFLLSRPDEAWPGDATPFNPSKAVRLGVVLAFCAYSKYSAILAFFLILICGAGLFNSLVAGLVSLALYIPHLYWNATVGLAENAGIFFQINNGMGSQSAKAVYTRALDLVSSQIFLWTPLVFLIALFTPFVKWRKIFVQQKNSELIGTLFLWTFVPLIFFSLSSLKRPAEANWPLIGLLSSLVLVLTQLFRRIFSLYAVLLSQFAILFVGFMIVTNSRVVADLLRPYFPKIAEKLLQPSRLHEFEDWDKLHEIVFASTRSRTDIPIVVYNYQTLSELLFEDQITEKSKTLGWERFKIWEQARRSQFNLHPEFIFKANVKTPYWFLSGSLEVAPDACRLYQTVFKSPTELKTYLIYRCAF